MGLNWKYSFLHISNAIIYKVEFWYFKSLCNRHTVSNKTYQNFRDKRLVRPGSKCPNWQRSQPISYKAKFSQRYNIYLVGKFHIKQGQIIGTWNPYFQKTMKIGIEVNTVKIRKRAKFVPFNHNDYRDMNVANWDQNPLILTERDHLGISQAFTLIIWLWLVIFSWKLVPGIIFRWWIQN